MHELWQSVLNEIETTISHAAFTTWFKDTELVANDNGKITIAVANIFAQRQFQTKFDSQIRQILINNNIDVISIDYIVKTTNKQKTINREVTTDNPTPIQPTVTNTPKLANGGLNSRYTFANFIVGGSNDLAYTACQAVVNHPGTKYNPLFLYGGVGLGKTHLAQAVGNEIIKLNPKTKVHYTTSEAFYSDFVNAMKHKLSGFADKYRKADVLIVDDMQFIAGKEKSQDEFFHTINKLHQQNKQIIITSDRPPKEIPTLTDRLRSRFEWGMAIDIQMPDFETRCAILQAKSESSGVTLNQETIEFLANNIKTNIRELEGVLNQLMAYSEMRGIEPDLATAEGLLAGATHSPTHHITAKQIINKTANYFQLAPADIMSSDRSKHIVTPRQIAMYLLRSETRMSFPNIAHELGRKDHTTAMHSVDKIEKAIKLDYLIREQVAEIRDKLYA
ncbi:chromosomal replication initiator protein DnaA [Candidatus Saccharibacteria bacterium]|nr:chromosomal replication initiator protein DnaA [Candidatus Saccharibacteria bacterium]